MGCDIHLFVEMRQDGDWQAVHGGRNSRDGFEVPDGGWYADRNYALFATLAGVRNRDNIAPISPPRGLPRDVSDEVRQAAEEWGVDGHSHSWLPVIDVLDTARLFGAEWDFALGSIVGTAWRSGLGHNHVRIVFWFDN